VTFLPEIFDSMVRTQTICNPLRMATKPALKIIIYFPKALFTDSSHPHASTEYAHKPRNTLPGKEAHALSTRENTTMIYLVILMGIFKIKSLV